MKAELHVDMLLFSIFVPSFVLCYIDLILYSREQINKENEAMGVKNPDKSPWGNRPKHED